MRHVYERFIKTKQELNSYVSDEDIIFHYFGEFEPNQYHHSPRGEGNASLVFDYYNNELKWRDFGNDMRPRDAVEFVIYLKEIEGEHLTFYDALNLIRKEVKKGTCPNSYSRMAKEKNVAVKIRRKYHPWELGYWKDYHLDLETLHKFSVFPCEVWSNGIIWHRSRRDDPCYVYMWNKFNSIWKAYRPLAPIQMIKGIEVRRKFFANNTDNHVQGWEQLPREGHICMITKSYKDIMVLSKIGIPAIAPHSENMFIEESMIADLRSRFGHVYVNYDNDKTGVSKSIEFTEKHSLNYWNVPITPKGSTDPSDYAKEYSLRQLRINFDEKFNRDNTY